MALVKKTVTMASALYCYDRFLKRVFHTFKNAIVYFTLLIFWSIQLGKM